MTQLTANRSSGSLCYIVSIVIWTIIGLVNSLPFKSLGKLSLVCSLNVFINILIICLSMGFIAHSDPNYASAQAAYGDDGLTAGPPFAPVHVSATGTGDLAAQVNGAANMIFGWSGAMVFVEFLNEMRRPYEFWKSFTAAETLVFLVYITYGVYVYAMQGQVRFPRSYRGLVRSISQYTLPVAFQGVSNYTWQSIGNGLSLWTYTMASVLYLNIAVKVA